MLNTSKLFPINSGLNKCTAALILIMSLFSMMVAADISPTSSLLKNKLPENKFWSLCYHDVRDQVDGDLDKDPMAVSTAHLLQHFEWLRVNKYQPVNMDQIIAARNGGKPLPEKAILLSFDDGYVSFYDKIYPLLKLYNYPAVFALVTRWLEVPSGGTVAYGNETRARESFLSWPQIREMQDSGLVEIASHSHDHHKGVLANPQGNKQAAFVTRIYDPLLQSYETDVQWKQRVQDDLQRSSDLIQKHTGKRPRIIVWPYGRYNMLVEKMASELGMTESLELNEEFNSAQQSEAYSRYLISNNPSLAEFKSVLGSPIQRDPQRVVHIDLDYVYDKSPAQQNRNLDKLLDRIKALNISTVYLQAFSDADGDGNADGLYFPNRHLPMQADLFNRVSWQLHTRADVEHVYAWMPVSAFVLDEEKMKRLEVMEWKEGVIQASTHNYRRLSFFKPEAQRIIRQIYQDLAKSSDFQGLLFHDDALLTDFEDVGPEALDYYRKQGLPDNVPTLRTPQWLDLWAKVKTQAITNFTLQLADEVKQYRPNIKTARNIYAMPIINHQAQQWFAQSLKNFQTHYDYTAVMAMPYMEGAKDPDVWLKALVDVIAREADLNRTVFELQSRDWNTHKDISAQTLVQQMLLLQRSGAKHFGYYPDDFHRNQPDLDIIRQAISVEQFPFRRQ